MKFVTLVLLVATVAVSAQDKRVRWMFEAQAPLQGPPAIAGLAGALAISDDTGIVTVDVATGKLLWRLRGDYADAQADERVVFAVPHNGPNVSALDARTGKALWTFDEPYTCFDQPPSFDLRHVYIANAMGSLHAIDKFTGKLVWKNATFETWPNSHAPSRSVVDPLRRQVYFSVVDLWENLLVAFDSDTGATKWKQSVKWKFDPVVVENRVVTCAEDDKGQGIVVAFDSATGAVAWQIKMVPDTCFASPSAGAGTLVVQTRHGKLVRLNPLDGAVLKDYRLVEATSQGVAVVGDGLYVGSTNEIAALRLFTGDVAWRVATPSKVKAAPVAFRDLLFAESSGGNVYAIDRSLV